MNLTEATGSAFDVPDHVFRPSHFTLANGLQAVVVENHRAPVVAHYVWYKVGCADSPPGKSGLPHFLEHLMFKGTAQIAPGEFSKIVARHGGDDNAFTSQDFTAYHQTIAKDRLPLVMEMEADRMTGLKLEDSIVYPERDVITEERRLRVDNEPSALLSEQLAAAQFLHHPYRLPVIGWMHEIESYTREDAEAFYREWYAPNNAVLIVVGDITESELRPLAERYYGVIPARPVPERHRLAEPPQHAGRRLALADERVKQPSLVRSYLAPSARTGSLEEGAALEVLAVVLGQGPTSRLYRRLVVERGLATGVACSYSDAALGESNFRFYVSPRPAVELPELEAALDEELRAFLAEGVEPDELSRIKKRMNADAVFARDSLGAAARAFGVALTTGGGIEDVEGWPARTAATTGEAVLAAARKVLDMRHSVTGHLLKAA